MRRTSFLLMVVVGLLVLAPTFSAAQSRLFDGASITGRIAPDSPTAEYSFDASRGDQISLRVLGLNGLDPITTVVGPDGADLVTGFDDAWSSEPGDSILTFSAPVGGAFLVRVAGEGDSAGDFVLQFDQSPPSSIALLPGGQAVPIPVSASAAPLRLQFAASPDCPTTLTVSPGSDASVRAITSLRNADSALIAQLGAGPAEKRVTVAADSGLYVAEIEALPDSADGQMVISVTCAAEQPACTAAPAAADTPAPAVTPGGLLLVQPGGDLVTGGALQGEIGQSSPLVGYGFEGSAGQEITVQVTGISFDFNPRVSLLGPALNELAAADDSPGGFRPGDAVLRAVLPDDGRYTALVGSADNLPGSFLIRLSEDSASAPAPLSADAPAVVDAAALAGDDGWFQRYTFSALDSCPTALDVQTAAGSPLAVGVVVRHAGGEVVGQFYPSPITGANLVVPAGSGLYEVLIPRYGDLDELGQITLAVSCQADSAACSADGNPQLISTPTPGSAPLATGTAEPDVTPTVTLVGESATGVTGVVNVASANVRRGDGQVFGVIRALPQGTVVDVLGISNSGSGWFKVRMDDGSEGWMAPFVLTIAGDLGSLPRLTPPVAPIQAAPTSEPAVSTVPPPDGGGNTGGDGGATSAPTPAPQRYLCACPNESIEVSDCNQCLFNEQGKARICPGNKQPPTCNPF